MGGANVLGAGSYTAHSLVVTLCVGESNCPFTADRVELTLIDGNVSEQLIRNIFFPKAALHDGAMIISQERIAATGCLLPVSHSMDIPKSLGLRHRAALGISQETDALAIVVSEETGTISVALGGELKMNYNAQTLKSELIKNLIGGEEKSKRHHKNKTAQEEYDVFK